MPRVFVTGATGEIGRVFLQKIHSNWKIVALTRKKPSFHPKNVHWIIGDITQGESYNRYLKGCDSLVHLAARIANDDPEKLRRENVEATLNLVQNAHRQGIQKIVVASSASVTQKFHTLYAESKAQMEKEILALPFPLIILRPTLVYHKGSKYLKGIERWNRFPLPFIPLANGGNAELRPLHAEDVGRALVYILSDNPPKRTLVYDLASEKSFTLKDAILLLQKKRKQSKPILFISNDFFIFFHRLLSGLGLRPPRILASIGAMGESYRVNPNPFIKKYKMRFIPPEKGLWDCS